MIPTAALVLLLFMSVQGVDLGGDLGTARASGRLSTDGAIELTLELDTDGGATVVAHVIEPGDGQKTYPLAEREAGVYRVSVEVRRVNYVVVFELIKPDTARQSQPLLLTDLGVRPSVLGIATGGDDVAVETDSTRLWGWAGLGLGALALLGIAIWAWPERKMAVPDADDDQRENPP